MNQPNLLELARQGDANAIAALMNAVLEPKGIIAKASLENGCLSVSLESAKTLNHQTMTTFVHNGLLELNTESIQTVRVCGQRFGKSSLSWVKEFEVYPTVQVLPKNLVSLEKDDEFEESLGLDEVDNRPTLTDSLKTYLAPTLLVMVVAFFGGGFVALLSTSKAGNQTSDGEGLASNPSEPQSLQEKQQDAEKYIRAMTRAQEKFYAENQRFAGTLEELERSTNLISQSYDYSYRSKIVNATRAQVTAVPKQQGLRSYVGTVAVAGEKIVSVVCRTDQPTTNAPPMPKFSQRQLQCQLPSSEVR